MKKFKRGLLPVGAFGAALLLMVSCGAQGAGYVAWDSEESPADLEVTITWWNNYSVPDLTSTTEEESRLSSSYTEYWWATDVISAFNELYPNITVNMTYIGSYSTIQSQVNSGLSGGNVPNIASCYGDHVAGYYNAGATLVMDEFMTDDYIGFGKSVDEDGNIIDDSSTLQSDMNQTYLETEKGMYASNQYLSLPYSKSSETLAVNLDVFNKVGSGYVRTDLTMDEYTGTTSSGYVVPYAQSSKEEYEIPTTWSELIALARQMKIDFPDVFGGLGEVKKDGDGLFTAIPFVYDSAENMIISMLEMSGVDYTDGSGSTNLDRVLFNNEDAKEIVVQLKEWYDLGYMCTQDQLYYSDASSGSHQYSSTMATQGTVFMCMSSTAGTRYFVTDDANFSFNPTPTFTLDSIGLTGNEDTTQHKVISQGPSLTFFDKADVEENWASWLFYKFLTNTDNSASLAVNTSYFPIRTSSYESDEVTALTTAAASYEANVDDYVANGGDAANAYTGQVLNLNTQYTEDEDYFVSDVFDESSDARTAIGSVIEAVFAYDAGGISAVGTDSYNTAVTSYVESQFESALASAIGA